MDSGRLQGDWFFVREWPPRVVMCGRNYTDGELVTLAMVDAREGEVLLENG